MSEVYTLITGASSGIGWELAFEYARHQHHLVLVARSEDKLLELKKRLETEFQVKVLTYCADLSLAESPEKIFQFTQSQKIQLNGLVNNAGLGELQQFTETKYDKIHSMLQVNMISLAHLTHLFLPELKRNAPSHLLNVASTAAFQAGPWMTIYYATKAFVLSFSEGLHEELKPHKVAVSALCPGPTLSNFQSQAHFIPSSSLELSLMPTSRSVAQYGYKKMMENKAIAIHGFPNKIMVFLSKFLPRSISRKIIFKVMKNRSK